MRHINLVGNQRAGETIERIKKIGYEEFDIQFIEYSGDFKEDCPTLYYGISNFNLSKDRQAIFFEDIIPNTLLSLENYEVINDYDLVIMKNPTRLLLWKDAKKEAGTKYYYVKNKDEWRINYSYGKVRGVFNKNISNNVFGKADITQWTSEQDPDIRGFLTAVTKEIAQKLQDNNYDLKSFGIDIIRDNRTGEFLFLELNQANSLGEEQVRYFLNGYLNYIGTERFKKIDDFLNTLDEEDIEYIKDKLCGPYL